MSTARRPSRAAGQHVALDRLLDWMLVCTLREWFDRPGGEPPAWWAARFSTAFKRVRGASPSEFRRAATAAAPVRARSG